MIIITSLQKYIQSLEKKRDKLQEETSKLSLQIRQKRNELKELKRKEKLNNSK